MTDAPDPLGKRALFWAPAERDEDGPRRVAEIDAPGKHALFSPEARRAVADEAGSEARSLGVFEPRSSARRGQWDRVTVECSSCGSTAAVHVTEFALLHLPVWMWWPGRGYTRFMTCPTCRRRTWVRASWAPWAR